MLDIHGVIDFCCGVPNPEDYTYVKKQELLAKQFQIHGLPAIKPGSIQKWLERGQVPGARLVDLHLLALKQGRVLDLNNFLGSPVVKQVLAVFG